jgi:hypothetical protein
MEFREAIPVGKVWLVQLVPPLLVVITVGAGVELEVVPMATQFEVDAHEMAVRYPTPVGTV